MDNGLPSLAAGKRRREGYVIDDDVKDNLKASRQWYGSQRADDGLNEGYQANVHYSGLSMENLLRLQQQQQMSEAATLTPVVPHLNMQQRVEAAAALQDLRGITVQPQMQHQMQQHMRYGIQQQQPQMQQILKTDASSLGELSSSCQPSQSPLSLPSQPYIRTPPLHSEADVHNGSPTSSSSGPYPSLPNMAGPPRTSQQCSAPIQLPESESGSSYSSLMHTSQSGLLAQSKVKNTQNGLLQSQQSSHSSPSGVSNQQIRGHSPQSGMAQQADQGCRTSAMHSNGLGQEVGISRQQAGQAAQNTALQAPGSHCISSGLQGSLQNGNIHHQNGHPSPNLLQNGMQNGVAFQHCGPTLPSNALQNAMQNGSIQQQRGQLLPNVTSSEIQIGNQLSQGDSSRGGFTSLHQQGRQAMPSSSHHQQGMDISQNGVPMLPQGGHRIQDGVVQHQTGHMSSIATQNPGQCISHGAVAHQSVQSSSGSMQQQQMGFPPLLREVQGIQQIPNSWYSPIRDTTTISETQPSVSTLRLQRHVDAGTFVPMNGTELGTQRGITSTALPQLGQVQSGFRDVLPDQDRHPHGEGRSPLHALGKVLPVQTDLQGRRYLQGNNFSIPSSSDVDVNLISSGVANGGLDDPALLQRTFMIPAPKFTRSYTKVYKLGSITRAVDVNRFSNYTELRYELASMFNLDGQLDQKLGWQLVFTDNEDDLLLVGDDPWEEFVRNVRGIRILTPAEVYYYTNEDKYAPAAYNSTGGCAPKSM